MRSRSMIGTIHKVRFTIKESKEEQEQRREEEEEEEEQADL